MICQANLAPNGDDFAAKDGRVTHDDFTVNFGKNFDLKFRGSVGFNDKLEMRVSVPVGPALLKKFGFKGAVDDYARSLASENARVEIPIRGNRRAPTLGKVGLAPSVEKVTQQLLREGVQNGLGDLLEKPGTDQKKPPGQPATRPTLDVHCHWATLPVKSSAHSSRLQVVRMPLRPTH